MPMLRKGGVSRITLPNGQSHDLTNQLELALGNAGYSRERIIRYAFLVETALQEWRDRLPADAPLSYARLDRGKDLEYTVELPGEPCNPFALPEGGTEDGLSVAALVDRLQSGVGNEIRYAYRRGVNRIRIRLPKSDVEDTVFRRNLFVLLVPVALEFLLETIASSVDAIMLSFSDAYAMSAVTMAMGFSSFQGYVIFACTVGATSLISQYWGIRDRASIGKVAGLALKVSVAASLVFAVFALGWPRTIMAFYTNVPEIVERGVPYVRLISFLFLLSPLYRLHYCCIRALGRPRASMAYAIAGCVTNVALNAVFIYGLFGAPRLGTLGVGIATAVSAALQTALALVDYLRQREFRLDFGCPLRGHSLSAKFRKNMLPTLAQCMVWILGANVIASVVGHMRADVVAANSLLMLIFGMLLCLQQGYGVSAGLLLGSLLGRGQLDRARHCGTVVLKVAVKLGLCIALAFAAIGLFLRYLPLDMNANMSRLVLLMIPVFCVNTVFGMMNSSICQGALYIGGDAKGLLLMDGIFMWGFLVPAALVGAYCLYLPELALIAIVRNDETLSFPLKLLRFRSGKWLKNMTGNADGRR